MAERVTPAGFGGSGRDVGISLDPIMFLVPLEDASTPPMADTADNILKSHFLLLSIL